MKEVKIALVGLGNVGKALVSLLDTKQAVLQNKFGFSTKIVAVATAHHGMAIDSQGIDGKKAVLIVDQGGSLTSLSQKPEPVSVLDLIRNCGANILFENSPVNHQNGQPAVDHLRTALLHGMHAITANKGPVVHAYSELVDLAKENGHRFLFESAVMDGAPIFSLFRGPLPALEVKGFSGILNSCTNILLELMENGKTFAEAVEYAQSIGITETDPSADIDGWDAAIKVAALSTVIMGFALKPDQVERTGIRGLTLEMIRSALANGERWKLVCSCRHEDGKVIARVAPEKVRPTSPLYSINGTSSYVQFETDCLPGLGIVESNPGPTTTAYGLLADLINAERNG
jgi:homoserine dehydrogenase